MTFIESALKLDVTDFLRTFRKPFQHVQVSLLVHGFEALLRRCELGFALISSMLEAASEFLFADMLFVFGELHVCIPHVLLIVSLKMLLRHG